MIAYAELLENKSGYEYKRDMKTREKILILGQETKMINDWIYKSTIKVWGKN